MKEQPLHGYIVQIVDLKILVKKKIFGATAGKQQQQQDSSNSIRIKWGKKGEKKACRDQGRVQHPAASSSYSNEQT